VHQGQCGCRTLELCLHHTPAAAKINIADKVPAAYRLIIDGDEVARVSSGPTKMTTAAGTLGYTFIWSVRLMSMIANAQKEIKMVFDGDPTPIAVASTRLRRSGAELPATVQVRPQAVPILACGKFGLISARRVDGIHLAPFEQG
jgi:hypothetical protein